MVAKNKFINWKNYLIIAKNLYPSRDKLLIERAKLATEIFPNNNEIIKLYRNTVIGQQAVVKSQMFSTKGLEYFNAQDYFNAALEFEKAAEG